MTGLGPSVCRGNPPAQLQGLAQLLPAHSTFHTGEQAAGTAVTKATTWHSPSTLIRAQPSSTSQLTPVLGLPMQDMWRKEVGEGSWIHIPAPEPIKTPRVAHSSFALRKKSLKWLTVMWLYDQGSHHNLNNLKKCRQNKWLKLSLSWRKGEEGREVGWLQAHGHGWITSYQTKASNSTGPLTGTWSMSPFKALKEVIPSMPFKVKLFLNII